MTSYRCLCVLLIYLQTTHVLSTVEYRVRPNLNYIEDAKFKNITEIYEELKPKQLVHSINTTTGLVRKNNVHDDIHVQLYTRKKRGIRLFGFGRRLGRLFDGGRRRGRRNRRRYRINDRRSSRDRSNRDRSSRNRSSRNRSSRDRSSREMSSRDGSSRDRSSRDRGSRDRSSRDRSSRDRSSRDRSSRDRSSRDRSSRDRGSRDRSSRDRSSRDRSGRDRSGQDRSNSIWSGWNSNSRGEGEILSSRQHERGGRNRNGNVDWNRSSNQIRPSIRSSLAPGRESPVSNININRWRQQTSGDGTSRNVRGSSGRQRSAGGRAENRGRRGDGTSRNERRGSGRQRSGRGRAGSRRSRGDGTIPI